VHVLLLGASGFIGSEIARKLLAKGHKVTGVGRDLAYGRKILPELNWLHGDLRELTTSLSWQPFLEGVDAVVNASGALQDGLRDSVSSVQASAIKALVAACRSLDLRRFVQISASNAEPASPSDFMASKAEADAFLCASGLPYTILRPGLVIGRNAFGGSEMIRMAASLPCLTPRLPDAGAIQCVAMSDVVSAVVTALENPAQPQAICDLVGRDARDLSEIIAMHRQWLGFGNAGWTVPMPMAILRPVSLAADLLGWLGWRSPLRSNAIAALREGISGNADQTARLLGHEPLSLPQMLAAMPQAGKADRWHARSALVFPLALASLWALWFFSGILGLTQRDVAAALLIAPGSDAAMANALVTLCSFADITLAMLLLLRRTATWALQGMILLALAYLIGSALLTPGLWLDPLGPMLKVLPGLALMAMCLAIMPER